MFEKMVESNTQIDISRQDSSHSLVTVLTFCYFLAYLGVPEDLVELYFEFRCETAVKSLTPGVYLTEIRFTLGSGDPFTLICNMFQSLCTIIWVYVITILTMLIIKGDDITAAGKLVRRTDYCPPEIKAVKLKVNFDLPAFHASRFILKDRMFDCPVKMVLKTLSINTGSMLTYTDLYLANADRVMDFGPETLGYMEHALVAFYPDVDYWQADLILRLARKMRTIDGLMEILPGLSSSKSSRNTDRAECVEKAIRSLGLGIPEVVIKGFRGKSMGDVMAMCDRLSIPVFVGTEKNRFGIWIFDNHAEAVTASSNGNFSSSKINSINNDISGFRNRAWRAEPGVKRLLQGGGFGGERRGQGGDEVLRVGGVDARGGGDHPADEAARSFARRAGVNDGLQVRPGCEKASFSGSSQFRRKGEGVWRPSSVRPGASRSPRGPNGPGFERLRL